MRPLSWTESTIKASALFVVALALLLVAAALSYRSSVEVQAATAAVAGAFRLLREAQDVLILVTDAETGQRGYLLTGDRAYLSPYERVVTSLPAALQRFRTLTSDSPEQKRGIDELSVLLDEKMAELAATVGARRTADVDAALEIVRTGKGQALMDRIRQTVGAIIDDQSRQLEARQAQVTRRTREAIYITVGALVLAMAARGHGEWPSTAARYFADRCRHARKRITPASSNVSTLARSGITLDISAVRAWS